MKNGLGTLERVHDLVEVNIRVDKLLTIGGNSILVEVRSVTEVELKVSRQSNQGIFSIKYKREVRVFSNLRVKGKMYQGGHLRIHLFDIKERRCYIPQLWWSYH